MNNKRVLNLIILVSLVLVSGSPVAQGSTVPVPGRNTAQASKAEGAHALVQPEVDAAIAPDFGTLPLSFVPNTGQSDPAVRFQVRSWGGTLFFTPNEVVLSLPAPARAPAASGRPLAPARTPGPNGRGRPGHSRDVPATPPATPAVVRLRFEGANPAPEVTGAERLPGIVNYFIGNDPAKWRANLPTYAGVVYQELYPGIDLRYDGTEGMLKGTYVVSSGADPSRIRWRYDGATSVHVDEATGDLLIRLSVGAGAGSEVYTLTERAPVAWQIINGQRIPVTARHAIADDGSVSFALGNYDPAYPLTLDPTLIYSTYLGGSDLDVGTSIVVDSVGNIYVTGVTRSTNFPTTADVWDGSLSGSSDAFVAKLNAAGSALLYSTYLGGSNSDEGTGIAVDGAGNAYVTGRTNSTDFPTVIPLQPTNSGGWDAFVVKINASGSTLIYGTYLGGSSADRSTDIVVDSTGCVYITGETDSTNFPTANPLDSTRDDWDAFVAKLNAAGSALIYSTYLGGSGSESGRAVAVDSAGRAYVTGYTTSTDFPTVNPLQPANNGGPHDVFIAALNAAGSAQLYGTYLGGSGVDTGEDIAVDGYIHVTGQTRSTDFPTESPVQAGFEGGLNDAFVVKLLPGGDDPLIYSTYLGGDDDDSGAGIAVDKAGNTYVTGFTQSTDFPADTLYGTPGGASYAFVTKLSQDGIALLYSALLGGSNLQDGKRIAVDSAGNAYIVGGTESTNFPTEAPLDGALGGQSDAFVTKVGDPDIRFRPNPHGYQFENYGGVTYSDYTLDDMRRMFGDSCVCYTSPSASCTSYKAVVVERNEYWIKAMNGGHCYGMSVTSLRFFKGIDNPASFQAGANTTHDLQLSNIRRHIAYYHVEQFVNPASSRIHGRLSASGALHQLHLAMSGSVPDPAILAFFGECWWGAGGHAVVPYAIEYRGGGVYWVRVYDNNWPDDTSRYVIVNTASNTWSYDMGNSCTWSGIGDLVVVPLSQNPEHPPCPGSWSSRAGVASTLDETSSGQVWLVGQGHLLISDSQGQRIGYVGSELVNEIPGAYETFIIGELGTALEPIYTLPLTDTYTILLDGQTLTQTETVEVAQFGPGYAASVSDVNLDPASQDRLIIAPDGTQLAYRPGGNEEATLALALDGASEGYQLQVKGADVGSGQVVTLTADVDNGQLAFNNAQAGGGGYDLEVRHVSTTGEQTFVHVGLVISATDTHYVDYGAWDGSGPMALHIDHGGDGTIDETLQMYNQAHRIYLPVTLRNYTTQVTFPLHIGDVIPTRPAAHQGEVFYTKSVQMPRTLPSGGH